MAIERFGGKIFTFVFGCIVLPGIVWLLRAFLAAQYGWSAGWLLVVQVIATVFLSVIAFFMNWKLGAAFLGVSLFDLLIRVAMLQH